MLNVYIFNNHMNLLENWLKIQPQNGRGLMLKISKKLRISTVLVSQIFSGTRSLQLDYAYGLAQFMGLNISETEYFILLVQFQNSGTNEYKSYLNQKILKQQKQSKEIQNRVTKDIELSEEVKAKFYSHWHYSTIRLMTDIPDFKSIGAISKKLNLENHYVAEILDFLVENKLCNYAEGAYSMALRSTHLENGSPWIYSRQIQWRQQSIQKMERTNTSELYYTGPMVLSKNDAEVIRSKLVQIIREITEVARESNSEQLMCLNMDWFQII